MQTRAFNVIGAAFFIAPYLSDIGHAQTTDGVIASYQPDIFAQYAPRTALEMLQRTPGFSLQERDPDERGLGQAETNVLINGQRIASKSDSIADVLNRIPARNVTLIEVLNGASLDIPGLSGQVANVIAKTGGLSGTFEYSVRAREGNRPAFTEASVSIAGRTAGFDWNISLENEADRRASNGPEFVFDGSNALVATREEKFAAVGEEPSIAAGLGWQSEGGHVLNLNGTVLLEEILFRETSALDSLQGEENVFRIFDRSDDPLNIELSGDYAFPLGPGNLKVIFLETQTEGPFVSSLDVTSLETGEPRPGSIFENELEESESIIRGEYGWQSRSTHDWQLSFERAFNTLESQAKLSTRLGPDLTLQSEDFTQVEETRFEAFITHGRKLTDRLDLQLSLGAEQSTIEQSFPVEQSREFTRPKGQMSLTYALRDSLSLTAGLERDVGQLDFFDFVSEPDLNEGVDSAGNSDIVPQQSWRLSMGLEGAFTDWLQGSIELTGEDIEDFVDQILFDNGTEGPGNIDTASFYSLELYLDADLKRFGWRGAELLTLLDLYHSEVEDPVTGKPRYFSNEQLLEAEVSLRHDIPDTDWTWGMSYESSRESPSYAIRQTNKGRFSDTVIAFVEHKNILGMTGRLTWRNILGRKINFDRSVFEDSRASGVLSAFESRRRRFASGIEIQIRSDF